MRRREVIALGATAAVSAISLVSVLGREDSNVTGMKSAPEEINDINRTGGASGQNSSPGDVINVLDHGATGDGETDDSGAIESAIRAADPGQTVFLPETEDSYLLSFDGDGEEIAIKLGEENLDNISIVGETARKDAQTLKVDPGSYDATSFNGIIRIVPDQAINGLTFRNLTIDGSRPEDDNPAARGGESALSGVVLGSEGVGGHQIQFQNCLVRDCSATAFRFAESGVTCQNVTALRAGRHGFNPVASETKSDPGFVGWGIKAVDCDGTGIDHRRGTASLYNVYTENNRSGNKWKHYVERLKVVNHHSVDERNHGWRSNHGNDTSEFIPEEQEILFKNVFVENPEDPGIRISGTRSNIKCDLQNVEVRNASVAPDSAGVRILRDVRMVEPGTGRLVVVGTENGSGVGIYKSTVDIDTYEHFDNDSGSFYNHRGTFSFNESRASDPGRNIFETPEREEVGAFSADYGELST